MAIIGLYLEPDSAPYTSTTLSTNSALVNGDRFTSAIGNYWATHYSYGIDFEMSVTISGITAYGNLAGTPTSWYSNYYSFSIYKSDDNSTWTYIENFDAPPIVYSALNKFGIEFTFSTTQSARYFKIVYTGPGWASFNVGGASAKIGELTPHFVGNPYSANRLMLTIDGSKIDGNLTNFPVNITLVSGTGINSFNATPVFDELTTYDNRKRMSITDSNDAQLYVEIEYWDVYTEDLTSTGYTHYENSASFPGTNMSDNNLSTYVQNYTYCAIDFGSPGKTIEKFRVAVHNSTARTTLLGQKFQGSNNSTNGSDGTWDDLTTFTSDNFGTPSAYPGFGNWITISGSNYKMYRLTGVATNNNVTNQWELLEKGNPRASLWTKVPTIASGTDTVLYLYYDATGPENIEYVGDVTQFTAQGVWDDDFVFVCHLAQDPGPGAAGDIKDSTQYINHGTATATMAYDDLVSGPVGKAIDFDGSDDWVSFGTGTSLNVYGDYTLEAIVEAHSSANAERIAGRYNDGQTQSFMIGKDASNYLNCVHMINSSTYNYIISTSTHTSGYKYHVATFEEGVGSELFIDTVSQGTDNTVTTALSALTLNMIVGAQDWTTRRPFSGVIDEVRLSKVLRTEAWQKATYYSNINNLITFSMPGILFFYFSDPIPAHLSTVYGTSHTLYLTTTISGDAASYIYDASFYNAYNSSLIDTASGIQSGYPASVLFNTPSGINYQWYVTATSSGSQDTSNTYTFTNKFLCSGQTQVSDTPASGIPVRLYLRDTGEYIGGTTSAGISGTFSIETTHNAYHYAVALYNSSNTNALIADWLLPD